jgi:hypothetical protein
MKNFLPLLLCLLLSIFTVGARYEARAHARSRHEDGSEENDRRRSGREAVG